ncbi:non-ribosomal peptide synthetase [Parvularcula sp. LCG005]|uniref:non-ribosomal peptide synthetase n=1 Tax=Parvularcula sp. LCG005 TaxID=3078805 RepID=UPI002943CF3F|nr:non-ribosomal peptide synthetase [Parvularcula sp. LCG005]WOI51991.1 amino acid adenylation domain-containing protein [Parvularcula sp. LCG005]
MTRKDDLIAQLTATASDLSGVPVGELAPNVPFLSLGFDSLFLTQLAAAYQKAVGTKVTFRQLIDTAPTIASLADHLDSVLPAPAPAPVVQAATSQAETPPRPLPPAPSAPITEGSREAMAALFRSQLELMQEQIRLLSGHKSSAPVPRVAPSVAPAADRTREAVPAPVLPKGFGPSLNDDGEDLSPVQRAHVDRLTKRYNAKTKGSKERTQRDRQYHADPRTASGFNSRWKEIVYPIVVERSLGARLWDVDGNEYVDLLNGFGPNFFGHRAPFIIDALKGQLDDGFEVGPQTPKAGEAARLLCELTGMDRVSWVSTGSEAVQAAMRISRTVTGRDKIVVFSGDYHGNFDEVLVRGVGTGGTKKTLPLAPGIPFGSVDNIIVCDYGEDSALERIAAEADDIAAVLVEPVQSRRPEFQPREFLHKLRDLTKERGIVLVFDEVITGFRTCPGGAQEYYGVKADLATYGKIIGGGMPIGVVAGRSEFMDTFDGGMWQYGDDSKPTAGVTFFAGTFVRHPMTIAAVHASLSYLKAAGPALQQGVNAKAKYLADTLNAFFEERGVKIFVAQFASQMFFRVSEESELATLFFYHLRDRGVHILEGFPSYMTAAHTDEDVALVIAAVKAAILEMQADDILPLRPGVSPVADERPFPLTPGQQEMWVTAQLSDEANCAFNESDRLSIEGPLDAERFRQAAEQALNAADALRLTIDPEGTSQSVKADSAIDVELLDWSAMSPDEQEDRWRELTRRQASTPFDLENSPLARAFLVRRAKDRHDFLLYAHHIAFDGYAADLLMQHIAALYRGDEPAALVPFRQYALADADAEAETTAYWLSQLQGDTPAALHLPTDRPFPVMPQFSGATCHRRLDPGLLPQIKAAARELGVSANTILFSAYAILLSRLTGQEDLVIGVPVAGQAVRQMESIGYGVEMMPLRLQPSAGRSVEDFVTAVRRCVMDGTDHAGPALMDLIAALDLPREPGRPTLVQAVFNNSGFLRDLDLGDCRVRPMENPRQAVFYELFMNVSETDGGYIVDWDYSTALFDDGTISSWIDLYQAILTALVAAPQSQLSDLTWMTSDAADKAYHLLRGPSDEEALQTDITDCIAGVAGSRQALAWGDRTMTYAQLRSAVDAAAAGLTEQGVGPGDVVGVLMERSGDVVIAMLAIWRCGGIYLPLDPSYPAVRLDHMVADSGARLIVCNDASRAGLLNVATILLSELNGAKAPAQQAMVADQSAYLIYTSGSTGVPKGVNVSHLSLRAYLNAVVKRIDLKAADHFLSVTTPSFDISLLEMLGPLMVGAKVTFANDDDVADGEVLGALVDRTDATMMQATPSLWRLLVDAGWTGKSDLTVLSGGEALSAELAKALLARSRVVWNEYGPTETTVFSTYKKITNAEDISAGTPLPNVQVYVVDGDGQLCPAGVRGEILIGGPVVAKGYWNREAQTAERFVPDRYSGQAGARLYRTGDIGYVRADGELAVLGRNDGQVKLRGFRVELGEIESALEACDVVSNAAVVVRPDAAGEPMLIAYTVYRDGQSATSSELRRALRRRLPNYMLPQLFVELNNMPLTANGKIDRSSLPQPSGAANDHKMAVPPRSDLERAIADIWAEMLAVEAISVTDNFFELGGQSLQAAQMVVRVRRQLGCHIAPRAVIFETLEQLAAGAESAAAAS